VIPTPVGVDAAVLAADAQARLDASWAATGLDGKIPQPEVPSDEPSDDWYDNLTACLDTAGVKTDGILFEEDGSLRPVFSATNDGALAQYTWYLCVAANQPPPASIGKSMLSDEEIRYIVDYWSRWLVPCIRLNGYALAELTPYVTDDSISLDGWSPYNAITDFMTGDDYHRLVLECGPAYGIVGIDS
jgi:hypothetical protein